MGNKIASDPISTNKKKLNRGHRLKDNTNGVHLCYYFIANGSKANDCFFFFVTCFPTRIKENCQGAPKGYGFRKINRTSKRTERLRDVNAMHDQF